MCNVTDLYEIEQADAVELGEQSPHYPFPCGFEPVADDEPAEDTHDYIASTLTFQNTTSKAPVRSCRIDHNLLTLTTPKGRRAQVDQYQLTPIASPLGDAYSLEKADGTTYDVLLAGLLSSCECKGWLRWGKCKHISSLTALQAAGKLPASHPATI